MLDSSVVSPLSSSSGASGSALFALQSAGVNLHALSEKFAQHLTKALLQQQQQQQDENNTNQWTRKQLDTIHGSTWSAFIRAASECLISRSAPASPSKFSTPKKGHNDTTVTMSSSTSSTSHLWSASSRSGSVLSTPQPHAALQLRPTPCTPPRHETNQIESTRTTPNEQTTQQTYQPTTPIHQHQRPQQQHGHYPSHHHLNVPHASPRVVSTHSTPSSLRDGPSPMTPLRTGNISSSSPSFSSSSVHPLEDGLRWMTFASSNSLTPLRFAQNTPTQQTQTQTPTQIHKQQQQQQQPQTQQHQLQQVVLPQPAPAMVPSLPSASSVPSSPAPSALLSSPPATPAAAPVASVVAPSPVSSPPAVRPSSVRSSGASSPIDTSDHDTDDEALLNFGWKIPNSPRRIISGGNNTHASGVAPVTQAAFHSVPLSSYSIASPIPVTPTHLSSSSSNLSASLRSQLKYDRHKYSDVKQPKYVSDSETDYEDY